MEATQDTTTTLTIQVDREHSGLRLGLIVIIIILWIVTFMIANALIVSAGFNIIAGIIAFIVSAVAARFIEPFLKSRWPSGRFVALDSDGVRLMQRTKVEENIRADDAVSGLLWRFKINRRSRVPKNWYVVACALEQDDRFLAVYTFVSPEQADKLNKICRFADLMSDRAAKDVKQDSLRVAGEQRRLRLAETHRWSDGAEMTFEDFERYMQRLNGQFSQWLP